MILYTIVRFPIEAQDALLIITNHAGEQDHQAMFAAAIQAKDTKYTCTVHIKMHFHY